MKKEIILLFVLIISLAGCQSIEQEQNTNQKISGGLTVVTSYTDAKERFADVETKFLEKYPDVEKINWESTGNDYDEYITTRMTSGDYGDVLLVPFSMTKKPEELPNFMEPLGDEQTVAKKYNFADQAMYDKQTYALPISVNTLGMIYNEDVFKAANVDVPSSSKEMYKACAKITENGTNCWYSNLNSMNMLWSGGITSYGGEQYMSDILDAGTITKEDQPYRQIYDFIYEMITRGYTEKDPMTSDYMQSEQDVANGDYAFMIMGSQSLASIKSKADNPEAIKMAPFPVTFNGKQAMPIGPDDLIGVSKNSKNKETAKAFVEFLLSPESGYAYNNGGFSPEINGNKNAPESIAYQLNDYETIRTIANETPEITTKFYAVTNDANLSSIAPSITELIGVATSNGDYQAWLDQIEERFQTGLKANE